MKISEEIGNWQGKPKELVIFLSGKILKDKGSISELARRER
ncbi:MAG: hypothetical protein ABH867_04710 [Patescibacteria group bacterium]